jgi:lysophospholipase L1-like esterase
MKTTNPNPTAAHATSLLASKALVGLLLGATAAVAQPRPEDKPLPPAPPVHAEFKFDFGPGKAAAGYTTVQAEERYATAKGYGFDFGSKPVGVARSDDGFVTTSESPFFFSVKAPEGNYRITVTLGDPQGESDTTIRTESGHLHAVGLKTAAGKFLTRTFYANVRRPELPAPPLNAPGGSSVHMFIPGEAAARHWDEKLTIEFNGPRPCLAALEIVKDDTGPTLFVAGDSTTADPRTGPGGNWPAQLCQWLKPGIVVCNSASSGETTKSFITGQRMDKVLSQMKPGDFFLIQFAHNDSKPQWPQTYTEPETTFKAYLNVFLTETQRHGGTLVLVTPQERRNNGDTVGPWARAMREFAAEHHVPLIDQWAMSKELWTALGSNVGTAFADQTHLSGYGGYLLSKIIVRGIKASVPTLAKFIVDDFKDMEPSHPEPAPDFLQQSPGPGVPLRGGRRVGQTAPAGGKAP